MTRTPTYGLMKPAENEYYNVEVFNQNADTIDEALSQKATLDENGRLKKEQTPDAADIPCAGYDSIADAVGKLSDAVESGSGELADSIEKIVDGTTKVGDAQKLGGQAAGYYAAASALAEVKAAAESAETAADAAAASIEKIVDGTTKVGDAQKLGGQAADYYATKSSVDAITGSKGAANGIATLDANKKLVQMPSFTDVGGVNSNLLHNWYFVNPVNRKGLTSYSGKGITVDRWNNNYPAGTVTLDDGGLTLGEMKWLIQDIKRDLNGEKLTASLLTSEGNLLKGTLTYTGTRGSIITSESPKFYVQIGPSEVDGCTEYRIVNFSSSDPITIAAVKLEIGGVQTLAHEDSSGKWVLNEVPDFAGQMAICGQYDDNGSYIGAANAFAPIKEKTAGCTLSAADAGGFVSVNSESDVTVTVPADADVGFAVGTELEICRMGAGNVTIAGGEGVTVNSIGGELSIAEQFGCAALKKTAADVWLLSGNLG